jgi:Integrase zinc binding domain
VMKPHQKKLTKANNNVAAWTRDDICGALEGSQKMSTTCELFNHEAPQGADMSSANQYEALDRDTSSANQSDTAIEIPHQDMLYDLESFEDIVSMMNPDIPFPSSLKPLYEEDRFFANIAKDPSNYWGFIVEDGLFYVNEQGTRLLSIPDGRISDVSIRESLISHAHSLLAHLSGWKTFHYLREHVWWPGMYQDVLDYCQACHICATSKASNQKPMGMLKQLPVPHQRWQQIGVDFVGPLPRSSN